MKRIKLLSSCILALLIGIGGGMYLYYQYWQRSFTPQQLQLLEKIQKIDTILEKEYLYTDDIDHEQMQQDAIMGYVHQEKDPYTSYFTPKANSGFISVLKGSQQFAGIGAVITKKENYILVEDVLKKSPAALAGIQPLDHILTIDSKSVIKMDTDEAVQYIRGEEGTIVDLQIQRKENGEELTLDIPVKRGIVDLPSAYLKILETKQGKKILYVQLILIGEETDTILKQERAKMDTQQIDGIIIDVRDNGGGYMPVAVDIVGHFVPKHSLVTSAEYKNYPSEKYYTKTAPFFQNKPMVVLVNKNTASAGEIIALGLKELIGAKLLGTQTFGKGSIQTLYDFPDTSSMKYTIGRRYSPTGKTIDKVGIQPDISLEFDVKNYINTQKDNQLEQALTLF